MECAKSGGMEGSPKETSPLLTFDKEVGFDLWQEHTRALKSWMTSPWRGGSVRLLDNCMNAVGALPIPWWLLIGCARRWPINAIFGIGARFRSITTINLPPVAVRRPFPSSHLKFARMAFIAPVAEKF